MSLEGAKLICLKADDNGQFETISANGKTFKFGYYMDCDVILEHPNAMGLQCVINCDAFGRVTIENRSLEQPITLDGKTLLKLRPLLHNTEICIFDKKYLWQFDGNPDTKGFQMEDIHDFTTPSKQIKKPQQPPNSEPARKWRRPLQTRLTIHSFAYCIKAGESPIDIDTTTDENKPLNIHEQIIDSDIAPNKRLSTSPTPPENILDLINLNTPKQRSFSRKDQPLSCCKLSETVITSYSPRETGIRQEKSFAIVQSPLTASKVKLADTNLGPFYDIASPQTIQNCRSSMHLIDLTTPKKLKPPASSPIRTFLKSTLKKNLPKGKSPHTPQKYTKVIDSSTPGSSNTVYSVRSTDDESIIILSDDCSGSPLPIAKTPPRARTPQSLMKRAILSSAKKVAINKKFLNLTGSKQTFTPTTSKNPSATRFQSQSTPQRKSLGRCPSSAESLSAGKLRRSLITSTPFRQRAEMAPANTSRRSLLINTQPSPKKESRNSLMLKQALSMTHTKPSMTQKRNSVTCMKIQNKQTTSVSFIQHVEKEEQTNIDEVDQLVNHTFTIEEDSKNDIELEQVESSNRKDATFSPEKEKFEEECPLQSKVLLSAASLSTQGISTISSESVPVPSKTDSVMITSLERPTGSVVLHSADKSKGQASLETDAKLSDSLSVVSQVEIISDNQIQLDKEFREELVADKNKDQQSPQSSKINESLTGKDCQSIREETDYDFDGVDEIFKTPKAKNIMILSSPKSISLQKQTSDSVELIHSSEFDFSANLDELFQTPQSEFITRRVDEATPVTDAPIEALSPEEAFDMLVGRPIVKIRYARKTPMKKRELSPLKMSNDPNVPKTDIEEWIDSVNDLLEDPQGEDEMSYFTSTVDDISCDPLMTHSAAGSSNTNKTVKVLNTPRDEFEMTIKEENAEGKNKSNSNYLKDPLEMTVSRSLSPNISGIGLLDHTSESIFSETLAVSDDSSLKETEKTLKLSNDQIETTLKNNEKLCNVSQEDKARREIEEAFTNFEKQRKALDEKRLASTPEPKKPSISRIAKRITMGNQLTSDLTFDLNEFKVVQTEQKNQLNDVRLVESVSENVKKEMRIPGYEFDLDPHGCEIEMSLHNTLVSEEKLASDNRKPERFMGLEFDLNTKNLGLLENKIVVKSDTLKTLPTNFSEQQVAPEQKEISSIFQVKRGLELAFENFEERPEFSEKRKVKTPEPKKVKIKDHRRTLDSALVPEVRLDLQAAKAERELELAFENFEEQPEYSEERVVKTPKPKKVKIKDHRRTVGSALVSEVRLDLQAAKAERELELAFENFEEQPEYSDERIAKTPEPKKVTVKDHRRTLGSALVSEVRLDLQAAKAERELELAFENFEEQPEYLEERVVKTPEPKKVKIKDHRRTVGSALVPEVRLDLQAAKAERELELAFENFEEQPEYSDERIVKTPEPKKVTVKDYRRTLGSALVSEVRLDLQAAKAERELELAFENFEEQPEYSDERIVKTPEPKKVTVKDHRRTLGSALVSEVRLDLQAAKAERELELAFENFEEQPEYLEERVVKTPEPKKVKIKDHRRTVGSALVSEVRLDLQAAKAERELELAFENFEEQPEYSEKRVVNTPEPKKFTVKDHRRTLGSALVPEVRLDLKAAKAERELELAFENFEEQPEYSEERVVKTPEPKKVKIKDHRRTLGSALVPEVRLDLQAAKAERELELAFENFEEQPEFSEKRIVKTPEPKKTKIKDHRRTVGSAFVPEVRLDLQAAKTERELELAFENFEEQPEYLEERVVKTPEPKKVKIKDHRRTVGSALVSEVRLDLQAAKAERELQLAFENFEEQPEYSEKRVVKTPEPKKFTVKDHRRTLGSALVPEVRLDLQAAKAERELELAFENFEEQPEFSEKRIVKTPEPKNVTVKDNRRTLGSALVPEVRLDLQAAKAERELELAFENFEEQPEFSEKRIVRTPEPKKVKIKDHRRTLGSALVPEVRLDLKAAKAERELELAFENFEEQPEYSEERVVKTPEPKKVKIKDHRRTLGSALVPEVRLDLQAAKAERELELAFENFEEQPEFSKKRIVKTPEPNKVKIKDHRRTVGSALVPEVRLDLQAAKAERELELAFENFEEQPEYSEERVAKTPEPKKVKIKDHRRTVGSALVPEVRLDLQAAKAERELELAFENFEVQPEFSEKRIVKTPEPKKVKIKDHRRTLGSALVPEVRLDLQAAKAERELELAFENFEEQPEFSKKRIVKTPEPNKVKIKDHRRTVGSALVPEVRLDLQAAKAERELELAFENFEEQPEYSEERVAKTPEPKKVKIKDHRRTVGSALVPEVRLDLQAAKAERELELAFENFEVQPEFSEKRIVKTPEPKKVKIKDHRRTLGSALVPEVRLDLQAAKAERELELAFENFEEQPEYSEERVVKTPEPKKVKIKDHRRTVGSALVPEVRLDLQAAKAERELELAFENFVEQPKYSDERVVKTPEPKKVKIKDHRRTVGSALVPEVRLDLQAAKLDRELKLAFENLNEQPEFSEQPVVKPPEHKNEPVVKTEAKKNSLKYQRKTVGSDLETEVKQDLQAAKTKQELELAFENFEEQPDFSEKRLVMTPELNTKDHRRTVGTTLVQEVKLDLQEAKTEREMELAVENFEEQTESSQVVKTPELSKMTLGSVLDPLTKPNFEEAKTSNTYTIIPTDVMNVTVTPQREPENIINETKTREHARLECTELERNNEEENQIIIDEWKIDKSGSNILVHTTDKVTVIENPTKFNAYLKDKSFVNEEMQLKIVKKVILAKNKEHKVQKANRDFAKETYQDIASTSARSLRRRQKATAEEVKLNPNPIGMEQPETVNKEVVDKYENNKTVLRSTRKETVESLDDLKSLSSKKTSMTHQSKSQENLPQMRRTRQNSLDTFTDNTKSTGYQRKDLESSNKEDEAIKHSTQPIYSTDVDSTEDESHHSSKNPSRKRVRKIVSKIAETPVNETELHHSLEPINEEGITPVSKITNQDIDRKSLIGLRAEAEEILSPIVSRSRIRGRKAQLNVVLIESNDTTTFNTDKISPCKLASVNNYIEMHDVGNSKEEFIEQIDITKDADESIPSTPLPLRSRGRRPSRTKVTSNLLVAGLRKTRKGSVQKDTEIQTIDKVEVVLKNNDNILKDETKSGNDVLSTKSDDEDIVPSTPVETKTRRRQLLNKQKITDKTSRKASSTLEEDDPKNILGKFVEPKEKIEQNKTEYIIDSQGNAKSIETENSIQEQENVTYKKDEIENTATFSTVPSRTKGRKAILKHEIVSESKTCDQAQKTTEDIPPNKQEDESSDKKTVQFTSKTVSEIDISESIQAKSPTFFDEKIISLRGQNSTAEGSLKNLEFESVEAEKPVETSSVVPRIRGRRAALKVHLDQESITPNRRVGRPKKTHLPTEGAAQENDTHNDERSGKVVETLSSSSTQILTSPENIILSGIKINTPEITSNRRVGRSKAIEKTVPGSDCKSETSSGNDNCNIGSTVVEDASSEVHKSQEIGNAAPVVEKNMTSKTRARRAAVKPEFEVLAIKRNRKQAAEQIPDAHQVPGTENQQEVKVYAQNHQLDSTNQDKEGGNVVEGAQLVTPVPSKKRGRKAVEIVLVSHTPVIVTPKKTTINENQLRENKLKDEENVEIFGELPLSDVLKNHEIKNRNEPVADVENSMPSKTRGRRTAVKSENVVPTVKSGRNVVNEQISETKQLEGIEDDKKAFKINLQLDLANKEVDAAEQTVTPIKKRGRKAAVKVDPAVSPSAITTPVRRVGRRKASKEPILNSEKLSSPTDGENGGLKNEVVPINLLSSKTRGPNEALSLIHTRSVTENSTPVRRGVRRNIAGKAVNVQKSPESGKIKKGLYEEQDESAKLSPSISKGNENKVLLTLKSEEVFVESSSPIRRGGRIRGLQTNADNIATKSNVELPKSRGRKGNQKIEVASSNVIEHVTDEDKTICHTDTKSVKFEPALTENSPSVQKEKEKQKRLSVQEEIIEKEYESTKQTDRTAFKEKTESLNESSTTDGDIYENVSAKKRTRRAPLKLTEFIVSNLVKQVKTEILDSKSNGSDTEEPSSTASHKPGQPVTAKFENVGSSQENSTPARKRSRRAIAKIEEHKESAPLQRVNRRGKAKEEAAITLIQGLQNNDNKNDTSCELISDEEKLEGKFQKKITGRNIALLSVATSPSLPISEEQQTEIEVRTRTKSSRGKGKAELKNNSTVENTSHADEEQSASTIKPKSNRGRKPATKSDPDNEITQIKPSDPVQNYKTKFEISQYEDTEIIDKKQKRGIKAPIVEPVESSAVTTNKPSPVTKKTTRGRKAAVKNDVGKSDDQSIQLDVQTRSGKDQDYNKETTKPVSKRRNIEILTNDDQKDTPSKRTRRKPNKLLSDNFIS